MAMEVSQLTNWLSEPLAKRFLLLLVAFILVMLVARFLKRVLSRYVSDKSTRYQAKKLVTLLGYIVFALSGMLIFNYKLSNITLAVGLAGAGIAFALQEVIMSIAGFLVILSGKYFKVGDRVQMGGVKGDVVDIGVLRTTLMEIGDWVDGDLYNGKMVRLTNSYLFKEPVYNYSGDFPFLWDEIKIPVRTDSDQEYFKGVLNQILDEVVGDFSRDSQASWDKLTGQLYVEKAQIPPMITFSFDENWSTYTLRYVVDFKKRRTTKNLIYEKVHKAILQSGGKVSLAGSSLEVTLTK
ncbi:mechanosensitive ion channel protein MscS [Roseivirga thermotolerans]|uniref:Mechanosensitive ion channel protein MscS n=2 Tax=Roseivirgaceae TaxID=2762306 RepID=A0ABQ3I8T5_9BACT|nr:mechanosensitive ion channel protein MscS [Roseivirga thermotolerans]|tara:strand:- start:4489 stop:5373 length:885 start_codon:yes stop_codon:yes gene_type:complete